jgi:Zn-dependent protease
MVTNAAINPVPVIRIVPVNLSEIPPGTGPDGSRWTGTAFHFLPDHTAFDTPLLVSFTLSEAAWEQADPATLSIRETDATGQGFERLPTTIDPATRTASAMVRHFSIIGLFSTSPKADEPASLVQVIRTAVHPFKGPLPLSPLVPDAYAPLAAVAAGIAVSIIGALVSGSRPAARVWDRITSLVRSFLCSETVALVSTSEIEKRGIRPAENHRVILLGLSRREILVIGISTAGFAAAILLQDRLAVDMVTIIIFLCAGGSATIIHDLAHKFCATRCGCITEYQFWSLGTITMLGTAWLFGTAFAKPSRTVIRGGRPLLAEEAARIRLAGPLMSMGIAVVSLFLIPLGGLFAVAGSAGFSMNLLNSVFSLVPITPNDGVEVYAWNKLVWAGVFIPLFGFFLYMYLGM